MPNCAFLSIDNTEGWFIDDDLVHEPLQKLGWEVENIPWNAATNWNEFDLVIIRSPWDYQDHLEQFLTVLEAINQSNATLLNGLDVVKWNIDKNYLFELERKGIELVPTMKGYSIKHPDIESAFEQFNTEELIIKPMIGANADDTFRVRKENPESWDEIVSVFHGRECMIQPFIQSIVDEGEFSLMYFNGKLSHTILKTVGQGDYRVQEEHGGGVLAIADPQKELITTADNAMNALSYLPLYARVDLVRTPTNTFALMELELIEPALYFRFGDGSAKEFAHCIDALWNKL